MKKLWGSTQVNHPSQIMCMYTHHPKVIRSSGAHLSKYTVQLLTYKHQTDDQFYLIHVYVDMYY